MPAQGPFFKFVTPDSPQEVVKAVSTTKHVLTITVDEALVAAGHASLGVRLKADGRPEILLNRKRLQMEKITLAGSFRALVTVIE